MALHTLVADAAEPLIQVAVWALRTLVVALCAGFALAVFRVRSTSVRLFAWTAVLYAALAIPVLGSLLPTLPVSLPVDIQPVAAPTTPVIDEAAGQSRSRRFYARQPSAEFTPLIALPENPSPVKTSAIPWGTIMILFYFGVGTVLLVRLALGSVLSHRLLGVASPIQEPALISRLRSSNGVRLLPRIYESELVAVPVTIGVIRPVIVLPDSWREWDEPKLDTIFAHEMSHVDRRDALTQFVALLHRAIFWFSPLSWWLARHLANLAEQASDEAALSRGADRNQYAKTLLGFFEALETSPRRVWWQGVSMTHAGRAEQRVQKILAWRGVLKMGLKKSAVVLVLGLAIPVVYVAALAGPAKPAQVPENLQQPAPSAPASPAATPAAPDPKTAPTEGVTAPPLPAAPEGSGPDSVTPVAPDTPVAPLAPLASEQGPSFGARRGHRIGYRDDFDDEQRFVIVSGNSDSYTMSGTSEDARHVQKLRKQIPGDFIWFERDEKSYIVRDQATIDRARKLWAPQEELGKKQEELGKQQEALGKQQEALGQKMEQVRVNVPDMTAELDRLKAKMQKLGPSASMEQLGELQSEFGELQSKLGSLQSEAGAQQGELGEKQGELGRQQGELGRQQGELGRQQGELARKAGAEMKQLLDDAIKNGTAKPEPQAPNSSTL